MEILKWQINQRVLFLLFEWKWSKKRAKKGEKKEEKEEGEAEEE